MFDWFVHTLQSYPEIAIFLSLALGYYFGSFTYKGLGLGAVTATLIAAVIIGQLGITITGPLKPTFFLMFLFAIGYGVGPQFVRGISQDGIPQALFAVMVCLFCLGAAYIGARLAGYSVGSAAGLYAGSTTISASMGLATDAINRLNLPAEDTKALLNAMPVAYAVTYIFGTMGSAIILSMVGPALLGIDLEGRVQALRGKARGQEGIGWSRTAWHRFEMRAFRVQGRGAGHWQDGTGSRGAASGSARVRPGCSTWPTDHRCNGRYGHPGGRRCGGGRPPRGAGQSDRRGGG